jgi:hypothetical protein
MDGDANDRFDQRTSAVAVDFLIALIRPIRSSFESINARR